MAAAALATVSATQVVLLGPYHIPFRGEIEITILIAQSLQVENAGIFLGGWRMVRHGSDEVRKCIRSIHIR